MPMASSEEKRELLKGPLKKAQRCNKAVEAKSTIHFTQPQGQDQRGQSRMSHFSANRRANLGDSVTVFDSSATAEPFLASVVLENLRKRQQLDLEVEASHTRG